VQDTLEEKLGATECESGNVRVQWNSNKKLCQILSDLTEASRQDSKKATDYTGNDQ
jgi:hypothetical protein